MTRAVREPGGDWSVVDGQGRTLASGLDEGEARTRTGELQAPRPAPLTEDAKLVRDRPSRRLTRPS